jgi:WD40-like Beta Propeller Repeat
MKKLAWVVILLLILVACGKTPASSDSDNNPIFTDRDIDNAISSIATQVEVIPATNVTESLVMPSEGQALPSLNPNTGSLGTQAVLPNTKGFIFYIRHDPALVYPWRIQRVSQETGVIETLYGGAREIQSVASSADGTIFVASMKVDSDYFDVLHFDRNASRITTITNETNTNHTDVSMSADSLVFSWQKTFNGVSSIIFRIYTNADIYSGTFTEKMLSYPIPARQPSLSGNGKFLTYIHDRPGGKDQIWRYDLANNVYTAIFSSASTLEHPSITNDGSKMMFLASDSLARRIYIFNLSNNTLQQSAYSTKTIEHPFMTSDGKYMTYGYSSQVPSANPTAMTVYVKEIATGQVAVVRYASSSVSQKGMTWQIPEPNAWTQLGGNLAAGSPSDNGAKQIRLDSSNKPVAVVKIGFSSLLQRWTGGGWEQVGSRLDANQSIVSFALQSDNQPVIVIRQCQPSCSISSPTAFYVKRWDGMRWVQFGGSLNITTPSDARDASIVLDKSGQPVVAWMEDYQTFVKRWDGSKWVQLGTIGLSNGTEALLPSIVLDSVGNPVVAYSKEAQGFIAVEKWTGSSWVTLGSFDVPNFLHIVSLAIDKSDRAIIAWSDCSNTQEISSNCFQKIYVKRQQGTGWEDLTGLGTSANSFVSTTVGTDGNPVVAWADCSNSGLKSFECMDFQLKVSRWSGSVWTPIGLIVASDSSCAFYCASLGTDSLNNPTVLYKSGEAVSVKSYQ